MPSVVDLCQQCVPLAVLLTEYLHTAWFVLWTLGYPYCSHVSDSTLSPYVSLSPSSLGLLYRLVVRHPGCYVMSAYFNSSAAANMCASLYFMFNLLFGGLLLTERNHGIAGVMYLSTFNYGFQPSTSRYGTHQRDQ